MDFIFSLISFILSVSLLGVVIFIVVRILILSFGNNKEVEKKKQENEERERRKKQSDVKFQVKRQKIIEQFQYLTEKRDFIDIYKFDFFDSKKKDDYMYLSAINETWILQAKDQGLLLHLKKIIDLNQIRSYDYEDKLTITIDSNAAWKIVLTGTVDSHQSAEMYSSISKWEQALKDDELNIKLYAGSNSRAYVSGETFYNVHLVKIGPTLWDEQFFIPGYWVFPFLKLGMNVDFDFNQKKLNRIRKDLDV